MKASYVTVSIMTCLSLVYRMREREREKEVILWVRERETTAREKIIISGNDEKRTVNENMKREKKKIKE